MVPNTLPTSSGPFEFSPVPLFYGRKKLNKLVAGRNLLLLKSLLDARNIRFGLIYGTLLGAIRSNDFIDWDEDVDIFMRDEDRAALHEAFWELKRQGLNLVRHEDDLYSVMKDDEYIDIYVFRRRGERRWCNKDVIDDSFFEYGETIDFLGEKFSVPKDPTRFLRTMYGEDWRTPRQNYPARPWSAWRKFKRTVKDVSPFVGRLVDAYRRRTR